MTHLRPPDELEAALRRIGETRYKIILLAGEHYHYGWSGEELLRQHPDLRPETSWTWDAGVALLPGGGFDADLGFFRTAVRDRITTELLPSSTVQLTAAGDTILSTTSYRNVDEARISGIEGRLSYDFSEMIGVRAEPLSASC